MGVSIAGVNVDDVAIASSYDLATSSPLTLVKLRSNPLHLTKYSVATLFFPNYSFIEKTLNYNWGFSVFCAEIWGFFR